MQPSKIIEFFVLCLILLPVSAWAENSAGLVKKGNMAYQVEKYDEALKAYDEAAVDAPESPQINFNKGAAYYQKGDYAKAKEAWEKAALTSKDITLEAKATFNLGNCAYQEAKRQQDSDLKKAIDACTRSIQYYQQAVDLLQNQKTATDVSLKKEAAENIEMVRLIMKSILDEIAKQEQQAKQQQQTADELKKLIEKQQELIDRNQYAADEEKQTGQTPQLNEKISQMSKDQAQLQKETGDVAKKLPEADPQKPDPNKPDPAKAAKEHLSQAQAQQKEALVKINDRVLDDARKNQENALEELEKALDSMKKPNGQDGQQQRKSGDETSQAQGSDQRNDQQQDQKENDQKNEGQSAQENSEDQEKQERPAAQQADTAEDILNEEKENQKNRRPAVSGGYREIDKDW
jgi:Ca-activated chloride channel homolog